MTHQGALKPTSMSDVRSIWDENKPETKKEADVEDQLLSQLAKQAGWEILKDHIVGLKEGLDKRLAESVLGSLSNDQIKTDAVFAVLGKELLSSIINKVEDSVEEVNEITSTNK